jgi:putative FmdB family regulatory protein
MPTYEYRCEKCNQVFEAFQSMKDAAYQVCPRDLCKMPTWGEGKVKRLFGTGAGLLFKGSGFYITDYRSSQYREAASKESGKSTGASKGDTSSSGGGNGSGSTSAPKKASGSEA